MEAADWLIWRIQCDEMGYLIYYWPIWRTIGSHSITRQYNWLNRRTFIGGDILDDFYSHVLGLVGAHLMKT